MKAGDVRVCPSCQARNKAKWEFCVRCGESLQDVDSQAPTLVAAAAPAEEAPADGGGALSWALTLLGLIAIAGAGVFAATRSGGESQAPSPTAFVMPTQPAAPPTAPEVTETPGEESLIAGRNLLFRGDVAGALGHLAKAVDEAPGSHEARYLYAQALFANGSREKAYSQYREAARIAPHVPAYHVDLARALLWVGLPADAIPEYEAGLTLQPTDSRVARELADAYAKTGDTKEALAVLGRTAARLPQDLLIQQAVASTQEKAGDTAAAIQTYRKVVEMEPRVVAARTALAELLYRGDRVDEAIQVLRDGIAKNPTAPQLHRDLGNFLERAERYEEAIAEYRAYTRLAPNAPDAGSVAERASLLEEGSST